MLALDVALLIAALLIFAAWLSGAGIAEDPQAAAEAVVTDLEGAATAIACAAALVRVYWRLAGKLD